MKSTKLKGLVGTTARDRLRAMAAGLPQPDPHAIGSKAHANLKLKVHEGRLPHNPNTPGKQAGDHAGHLFGDRFGGSPRLDNLVSQAQQVNLSLYKILENQWATALSLGQDVVVDINVNYDAGSARPKSSEVDYITDGITYNNFIKN